MALPFLARDSLVFVWFSASSFVHGLVLWYALYRTLTSIGDPYGTIIFTHPDHPGWKMETPKGRMLFYVLSVLYVCVLIFSRKAHNLGAVWPAFLKSAVTRAAVEYFDMTTLGDEELAAVKGERVLLGLHPHGIYPMAGVLTYAGASPFLHRHPWLRIRPCAASVLFRVPLIREYLLWTGHLDAGKRTMSRHMAKREDDLALVIGGEKEALLTMNGQEAILLHGRTGFVQLAARYGYHLVPSYAFGQNELYTVNRTLLGGLRAALQRSLKLSIPVFWGRCGTPMPHRVKVTLAVGKPIRVPEPATPGAEPDSALVERLHAEYVAEVQALFERHKEAAGYADRSLQIMAVRSGRAGRSGGGDAKKQQ